METGKRPQTNEQRLLQANSRLTNENAKLRQELQKRDEETINLKKLLEKALLRIEELEKIVFRTKRKNNGDKDEDKNNSKPSSDNGRGKRGSGSYQRPIPAEEDITDTQECIINNCPDCGNKLTRVETVVRYVEDIVPMKEWFKTLKKATKLLITTGYCRDCQKRVAAGPLPKSTVSLGGNVRQFIVFSNIVLQLSYGQIRDFLAGTVRFNISDGEIINILEEQSTGLKPEFERIKESIRGQPGAHFDETIWNILQEDATEKYGNYAWIMTGIENTDAVFQLGRHRGKGNINDLAGEDYGGVGVSDDYGAYKNAFNKGGHALCWAHPHRKLRDLKNSDSLTKDKKEHCLKEYEKFAKLYAQVREVCVKPFCPEERIKEKERIKPMFLDMAAPRGKDPEKLAQIKRRLLERQECYFTCITEPNVPPDNNKAERGLRHLVLKRRKSFGGSKTRKGADMMSILYSVILSLWWRDKENFFNGYDDALSVG